MIDNDFTDSSKMKNIGTPKQKVNYNTQGLQTPRNTIQQTPSFTGRHTSTANPYAPMQGNDPCRGQILGVRNLRSPAGPVFSPTRSIGCSANSAVMATPTITPCAPSYAKVGVSCELAPSNEKSRDNDRISIVDRNNMEYNLNAQENVSTGVGPKKNVKGVKLVGMEGGTLRRPSLQVSNDHDLSSSL